MLSGSSFSFTQNKSREPLDQEICWIKEHNGLCVVHVPILFRPILWYKVDYVGYASTFQLVIVTE